MNERGSEPQPAEPDQERPRYDSISDYLRVINRHKVLIALITVAFLAGAFLYSASRPETYEAEAHLSAEDVLTDLSLLGVGESASEVPLTPAQPVDVDVITRPEVRREARRRLDADLSLEDLSASVSARLSPQTNQLIVEGRAADPQVAADLANAYAQAIRPVVEEERLDPLREVESAVAQEVQSLEGDDGAAGPIAARLASLEQLRSRIQALEQVAEPVQVVRRATAPAQPSSPRTRRDVALGGLIGLALGLVAAFGRAALDRRVHTADEVHRELGAPVLTRVGESALGSAGLVANGQPPMVENDFEAFRVLRTNLGALGTDPPPRSVLVTSILPEEGKSTVSVALASATAIAGQRVLLIECDLRRPLFDRRLGVSRDPGLTDYLLGRAGPDQILQTVGLSYPRVVDGAPTPRPEGSAGSVICIAAGGPVPNPAELLITDRFRGFLEQVTKAYDLVVVDSGPLLSVVDSLELIPQVDAALICVRAQRTTVDEVRAARAALANLPERPIGAVLTGLRRTGPDPDDYYYGY